MGNDHSFIKFNVWIIRILCICCLLKLLNFQTTTFIYYVNQLHIIEQQGESKMTLTQILEKIEVAPRHESLKTNGMQFNEKHSTVKDIIFYVAGIGLIGFGIVSLIV